MFNFASVLAFVSRWPIFAQSKSPDRQMLKAEGKDLTIYFAEDRRRFEYPDKVVIEWIDQKRLFVVDLKTKTYTEPPYEPMIDEATKSGTITHEKPKPEYPNFLPYDPKLFEAPQGFRKANE
jgi:hypothetical protein